MSRYIKEWPCCGDETKTDAWIPESCPFCGLLAAEHENEQLRARLTKHEQAVSVPDDRVSVHEYTARIALQALEEYAENLSIVAGWDYEPLEYHYAQQAIEDIQDKLTEKERGHD